MTGPTDRAAEKRHQRERDAHRAARARKAATRAARHRAAAHTRARALDHLLARERRDLAADIERRRADLARLERLMTARPSRRG